MLKNASWSITVLEVETGKAVATHQSNQSLIPASSLKVVTTATALSLFGPEYSFPTRLTYSGTIESSGVLQGNVYLEGQGDPTLGSDQFSETQDLNSLMEKFRLAIQQKGIRRITGNVVGDGSYFGTAANASTWQWKDMGNYYGAGAWGLNIHENLYYLSFKQSSRIGNRPQIVEIAPFVLGLSFQNEVTTAGSRTGDNAYIYGAPYTYERFVRGTIPAGSGTFTIKGSIPDPPLFSTQFLVKQLQEVGIPTELGAISHLDLEAQDNYSNQRFPLITHYSPKLERIVDRANKRSVNLYCESLLRAIGKKGSNKGTADDGLDYIATYWKGKGLNLNGCSFRDGSGLSPRNLVTTTFLANLMRSAYRNKAISQAFYDSLPEAGKSGTLRYRFRGTAAQGKIRAKTGTLGGVRSFTGYATSASGKLLAFSFIVNNFSGSGTAMRKKMERVMLSMCL